jgi:hypothetical protein
MVASLTGANAVITLSQAVLFPVPQQLQGFAADNVTGMDAATILERYMGVDGVLSFGFVWTERVQNIHLQANSASNAFFDVINAQQQAIGDVYTLSGTIYLPSIGLKLNCSNGGLENYPPMPEVKKLLQPRTYRIIWNLVSPAAN